MEGYPRREEIGGWREPLPPPSPLKTVLKKIQMGIRVSLTVAVEKNKSPEAF